MKSVTYEEFKGFGPCWVETPEGRRKLERIGRRKERWTAVDILDLPDSEVSAEDKLWAALRPELIEEATLHEFACRCAEEALKLVENPDPGSVAAIEAKRKWLKGEITDQELDAARDAASAAAIDASAAAIDAIAAAWAARDAAWAAASAAASAASAAAIDASAAAIDAIAAAIDASAAAIDAIAAAIAARDAAWDAARAAASAAASAASAAAIDARASAIDARASAWDAARKKQVRMLWELIAD